MRLSCVELCADGGGQALGLEMAGFDHLALVELDSHSVRTLRQNRPEWNVIEADLHSWDPGNCKGADLVAALALHPQDLMRNGGPITNLQYGRSDGIQSSTESSALAGSRVAQPLPFLSELRIQHCR